MSELPAKTPVDWELAKLLFCQNAKRSVICEKAGCRETALDRRVTREKWVELRQRFNQEATPQTMSVSQRGALVRQLIASEAHAQIHNLSTIPNGKNADAAYVKASTLDKLSGVAEKTFGSVGGKQGGILNIALMASVRVIEPSMVEHENVRRIEHSEGAARGWTKITEPDGSVHIVDDRESAVHPSCCADKPPPHWKESPPTRALPETTSEPVTVYTKYNVCVRHRHGPESGPVIDMPPPVSPLL